MKVARNRPKAKALGPIPVIKEFETFIKSLLRKAGIKKYSSKYSKRTYDQYFLPFLS